MSLFRWRCCLVSWLDNLSLLLLVLVGALALRSMVLGHSFEVTQAALPLGWGVDAVPIELVEEFVCIRLGESVVELLFEFWIQLADVFLGHIPLLSRAELLYTWIWERLEGVVLGQVFVWTEVHLEAEHWFVWKSCRILPFVNEMLELRTVARVIEINHTWS